MSAEHLSDLQLDALRLGAVTDVERTAVELHLSSCDRCRRRRDTLARSVEAFNERFDPPVLATELLQRAPRSASRWRFSWIVAPALAAAIVLIIYPRQDLRIKGSAELVELHQNGERVRGPVSTGSSLRLRITVPETRYIRILWHGPSGSISALHPEEAESAIRVSSTWWMPREIALDDERLDEILHAVACEAPFDHARALAAIRGATDDCVHQAVTVAKR